MFSASNKEKRFTMKKIISTILKLGIPLISMFLIPVVADAQLNNMGTMYFQNQFLGNPAMAGTKGLNIDFGFRKQWSNIPGSPLIQNLAADYPITNKAGIGFIIKNEKSGLFNRTRTVGSYAYHLRLKGSQSSFTDDRDNTLSFGISLGMFSDRIQNNTINGDMDDADLADYNLRETYFDGDFGIAYTDGALNIQVAFPNLKGTLKRDLNLGRADRAIFYSSLSYKIPTRLEGGLEIEPKAAFRGIEGFNNIVDAGLKLCRK